MSKKTKKILILILILLLLSLTLAYIIEHVLGHKPCELCIYQRFPYFVSILLILNILLIKKYIKTSLITLSLVSLFGFIIALYHVGIEQGFLNESFVCKTENLGQNLSKEDLLKQLGKNTISCKDVPFRVLGLSLASINTILSFVLFYIFLKIFKNYEVNR